MYAYTSALLCGYELSIEPMEGLSWCWPSHLQQLRTTIIVYFRASSLYFHT